MGTVVELHIKSLFEARRKRFHRRIIRIQRCVADSTHRPILVGHRIVDKLAQMASDTGFVPRELELTSFRLPLVTRRAIKLLVLWHGVRKLFKG